MAQIGGIGISAHSKPCLTASGAGVQNQKGGGPHPVERGSRQIVELDQGYTVLVRTHDDVVLKRCRAPNRSGMELRTCSTTV